MINTALFMLLCSVISSHAMTSSEIASFYNGAVINSAVNATYYKFTASGLPEHSTSKVNPNDASQQNHDYWIKKNPTFAARPTCLPLGEIGLSINGVSLFNPLTIEGYDAVTGPNKEIFDSCNGHPTSDGTYHYHQIPNCVYNGTVDEFLGVALDGFSIYGPNVSDLAREITTSDLDSCHGRNSTIKGVTAYRYYVTRQFPYIIGCFMGDIVPRSDIMNYNTSYVCQANTTACNCPLVQRRPPPGGNARCNISNLVIVSVLAALAGYFAHCL